MTLDPTSDNPDKKPSDLELQILSLLWQHGPMTVRQVLDALPDKRSRAYTTVLSTMQVMEKKSFLTHTQEGTAHLYAPKLSRTKVLGEHMRKIVSHVFGGSRAAAIQQLLSDTPLSESEFTQIESLIQKHKKKPTTPAKPRSASAKKEHP